LDERVFVVFNPHSGKGRGATLVEPVLQALRAGGPVEHALSSRAGEEGLIAEQASRAGFGRVVAVGGDDTWGNVGDALIRAGATSALGLIAAGTGCDLAKSLGLPYRDALACARVVRNGRERAIDAGRVEGKHFLNIAGFGFDVSVLEHSWRVRWLRGEPLYLYCALRQIHAFPGFGVEVIADGESLGRRELLMLVLANARVFGGGFRIAPEAELADGRLDAMLFENMRVWRRLAVMRRLLQGSHALAPEVLARRAKTLRLRFEAPPSYETDGEWNRARSAELLVETVPGVLRVLVPGGE
jgi:diacylglycerol kinase (ATP)